jgi:hypothetical protein
VLNTYSCFSLYRSLAIWYYPAMIVPAAEQLTLADFDFPLPESLIAQEPAQERDRSRLMVLDRSSGVVEHRIFQDIESYLLPGDLLVLNNTRVFPCRLPAKKPGGGKAEIFLLAELGLNLWDALVKGGVPAARRLVLMPMLRLRSSAAMTMVRCGSVFTGSRTSGHPLGIGRTPLPPISSGAHQGRR